MEKKIFGEIEEFVCTKHAEGISTRKIASLLKDKDVDISHQAIVKYLNAPINIPTISKAIEKFRSDPMTVDIAHKKIRLYDLNKIRLTIIASMDRYVSEDGLIQEKKVGKYLSLSKRLVEIEMQAREEVEKKPDLLAMWERTGPYSELTDEELRAEDRRITERLLLIRSGNLIKEKGASVEGERVTPKE